VLLIGETVKHITHCPCGSETEDERHPIRWHGHRVDPDPGQLIGRMVPEGHGQIR